MRTLHTLPVLFAILTLESCQVSETAATTHAQTPAPAAQEVKVEPGRISFPLDSPQLARIRVEPAAASEVPVDDVAAPGKVEANGNRLSRVLLPLAGRVTQVMVRIGDSVEAGQPLLTVESPDVEQAMSTFLQADAQSTQAKAGLLKAQADYDREKDLLDHNAVAQKDVLAAEATLVQAKTALDQAAASLQQAKRRVEMLGLEANKFGQKLTVRAPMAGKVLDLAVAAGEFRNDLNAPLMTIADLSSVWVTSDVPETAIRLVHAGESVSIELDAYPGQIVRGRVTQIADVVDPATRSIKVRAELANSAGRLRPDMFARIKLTGATALRPTVPPEAIVSMQGLTFVWREATPGVFVRTPVELGSRVGPRVGIMSGLSAGDRIVAGGVMLLPVS